MWVLVGVSLDLHFKILHFLKVVHLSWTHCIERDKMVRYNTAKMFRDISI